MMEATIETALPSGVKLDRKSEIDKLVTTMSTDAVCVVFGESGSGWTNALGLKYALGPPWITWPVKLGFTDGRTGLRVSPSFDGL